MMSGMVEPRKPPLRQPTAATSPSEGGGTPSRPSEQRSTGPALPTGSGPSVAAKRNAKTLRRRMTDAEVLLWSELKDHRKDGAHFRRQVPVGRYVVDFACHRNRLIVEIDGPSHTHDDAIARDVERTAFLKAAGYRVLRFTNDDVYRTCRAVIDTILAYTHQERIAGRDGVPPPRRGRWRAKRDGGGAAGASARPGASSC